MFTPHSVQVDHFLRCSPSWSLPLLLQDILLHTRVLIMQYVFVKNFHQQLGITSQRIASTAWKAACVQHCGYHRRHPDAPSTSTHQYGTVHSVMYNMFLEKNISAHGRANSSVRLASKENVPYRYCQCTVKAILPMQRCACDRAPFSH